MQFAARRSTLAMSHTEKAADINAQQVQLDRHHRREARFCFSSGQPSRIARVMLEYLHMFVEDSRWLQGIYLLSHVLLPALVQKDGRPSSRGERSRSSPSLRHLTLPERERNLVTLGTHARRPNLLSTCLNSPPGKILIHLLVI